MVASAFAAGLQWKCNPGANNRGHHADIPTGKGEVMAVTQTHDKATKAGYVLEGTLLEACSCGVLCPCWIGEDPDGGQCFAFNAYHFDSGTINGVDVSGLNIVNVVHIPGNVLTPGSWKVVMFVDSAGTEEQREAILGAYQGKLRGPRPDLAWPIRARV